MDTGSINIMALCYISTSNTVISDAAIASCPSGTELGRVLSLYRRAVVGGAGSGTTACGRCVEGLGCYCCLSGRTPLTTRGVISACSSRLLCVFCHLNNCINLNNIGVLGDSTRRINSCVDIGINATTGCGGTGYRLGCRLGPGDTVCDGVR